MLPQWLKINNTHPSAHSFTALTCSLSLFVMLLLAANPSRDRMLFFSSSSVWIPLPDEIRSKPQEIT